MKARFIALLVATAVWTQLAGAAPASASESPSEVKLNLAETLQHAGYSRISLSRSGVGHFHALGTLNDSTVSVLLDTGAGNTVVHLDVAKRLGLQMTPSEELGGGAGGAAMTVYNLPEARVTVGGVAVKPNAILGMDLSHANEALARAGVPPIEVILGVDVFDTHAAIIDYGSDSLFLKP